MIDELAELQEARAASAATMKRLGAIDTAKWSDEQRSQPVSTWRPI